MLLRSLVVLGGWMALTAGSGFSSEIARPEAMTTRFSGSAVPNFAWTLKAAGTERGVREVAYEIRVGTSKEGLQRNRAEWWDSGRVSSSTLQAEYAGKPLPAASLLFWQVRTWQTSIQHPRETVFGWSEPVEFTTALKDWTAQWIGAPASVTGPGATQGRMPIFRKSFTLAAKPTSAVLWVSGLGQYEVHVNGDGVTTDVLTPGWTDTRKRVLYNAYDVLPLLKRGPNAMGVMLGNGLYNVPQTPGRYTKFTGSQGEPKLILELHLGFRDGSHQIVRSDDFWKTAAGPITFSNAYGGEDFDARLEPKGWDRADFRDTDWSSASRVTAPAGALEMERIPPVRSLESFTPIATTHPKPGVTVYDLGQNFAGWPVLSVQGSAGATVRMLPGELLDDEGLVTQRSANAFPKDPVSFSYTLRGSTLNGDAQTEEWHPRFSYYGFRYVQVETSDQSVRIVALKGKAIHADALQTGHFTTSNELFQRIHTIILNAVRSNMVSVLTDCPHREKLGWLEQTHLFAGSLMANYDVAALYAKTSDDMADAQLASGLVPSIAPEYIAFVDSKGRSNAFRDSPEWGSAVILSPWEAYKSYGDAEPLRDHYASMQSYVAFLQAKASGGLLDYGLGDWYDIGPRPPGVSQLTSRKLTATATLYDDLSVLASIARLLHKPEDAARYAQDASALLAAFQAALFHPETNQYDRGSQTANAMPLALGMVPEARRAAVLENLVRDIEAHGYHVTAGDIGFHWVVRALTDGGRSDVLAKMMSLTTSPSYGYQVAHGATTLTEAWDTNPNSSQNHFMLGHGEEWFYRGLAGIDLDMSQTADEQILIHPYIPSRKEEAAKTTPSAGASLMTPLGLVESRWSRNGDQTQLEITVPANSVATLVLPAGDWTESGVSLTHAAGVEVREGGQRLKLVSGTYRFQTNRSGDSDVSLQRLP